MNSRRYFRPLAVESLEDRRVMATGIPWAAPDRLTVSLAPDGTQIAGHESDLFATLDAQFSRAVWRGELLRALQTWAVQADLNFGVVRDTGIDFGAPGRTQGDTRVGDIRVGAQSMAPEALSVSVPHDPSLAGTWAGDLLLNSDAVLTREELFAVLLHEVGHVLGLGHSTSPSSVMFSHLNQNTRLSTEDIQQVRALYGRRPADIWEGKLGNDSIDTATRIKFSQSSSGYNGATPLVEFGDITYSGDLDHYELRPLLGYTGPVTIRVQTSKLSLLAPSLIVTDDLGVEVGRASSGAKSGSTVSVRIPAMDPARSYFIQVAGANNTVFGRGKYALITTFDDNRTTPEAQLQRFLRGPYESLESDDVDRLLTDPEHTFLNDDLGADDDVFLAQNLVALPGYPPQTRYETLASLALPTDIDYYRVRAPRWASGVEGVLTATIYGTVGDPAAIRLLTRQGEPLPFTVLVNNGERTVIQATGIAANERYMVEVSASRGGGPGNYVLSAEFGLQAAQLGTFAVGELPVGKDQQEYRFFVAHPQLFTFNLENQAARGGLELTLRDSTGATVWRLVSLSGETTTTRGSLLAPGDYRLTVRRLSAAAPLSYAIRGAALGLPIGPTLGDPTLTPIYEEPTDPNLFLYPGELTWPDDYLLVMLDPSGYLVAPGISPLDPPNTDLAGYPVGSDGAAILSPADLPYPWP